MGKEKVAMCLLDEVGCEALQKKKTGFWELHPPQGSLEAGSRGQAFTVAHTGAQPGSGLFQSTVIMPALHSSSSN
jgi:hypothetical protein